MPIKDKIEGGSHKDEKPKMRKPFGIFVITRHGLEIGRKLSAQLPGAELLVSKRFIDQAPAGSVKLPLPFSPFLREHFEDYDCHIFIISVGAVVRMIAPLLKSKKTDPAVVCIDDASQFAICLLSGHVGRGNAFTGQIAEAIGAQPVITTASDVRGTLTVDILGRDLGWALEDPEHNVTRGCAAVVNECNVLFVQETGEPGFWPEDKPLPPGVSYQRDLRNIDLTQWEMVLIASDRDIRNLHPEIYAQGLVYRPKSLVIGLGCDKNTPFELLERGVLKFLQENRLALASVKSIATIDIKKEEPGLLTLSEKYGWPMEHWPASELDVVEGVENRSEIVKKYTGTAAVAEPACLLGAGASKLLLPKQKYTEPEIGKNMTMSVARIPFGGRVQDIKQKSLRDEKGMRING